MALDIISHRSSNNIFGKDLWGLGMSNAGLYGRLIGSEDIHTTNMAKQTTNAKLTIKNLRKKQTNKQTNKQKKILVSEN